MADAYPKPILPHLKGRRGELRIERFWSKVDLGGPDDCWPWQASVNSNGYGRFKIASYETATASRFALIATEQREPAGMHVLHRCDNPPCCNPAHLHFGTAGQNMADKISRGRHASGDQSGANNGRAKLNEQHIALIINRLRSGWTNTRIAADLPVTHSMVSLIRLGRMWRPVTERLGWVPPAPVAGTVAGTLSDLIGGPL